MCYVLHTTDAEKDKRDKFVTYALAFAAFKKALRAKEFTDCALWVYRGQVWHRLYSSAHYPSKLTSP